MTIDRRNNKEQEHKKDFWDKIASLSTLISGVLIAGIGLWATHHYNFAQLELRQLEALDKFRPLLSSEKPDEREFAYTAFISLGYEELAIKLIKLKDDRAGIKALANLSKSKNQEIRDTAAELLSKLKIQSRFGGKEATLSRLLQLHPNMQFPVDTVFSIVSFSLRSFDIRKNPARIGHVSKVIQGVEADIILIQELPNLETINLIASFLPDYEFVVNSKSRSNFIVQYQATFLKKGRADLLDSYVIPGEFYRPPICVSTMINGKKIDIVNLHLINREQPRTLESNALLAWEKNRELQHPVIISGVFNAEADDDTISAFHKIGSFATYDPGNNISTLVRGHRKLTHFVLGDSAQELYISKSIFIYELKKYLPEIKKEDILKEISDHNPVSISLLVP